jgi:DNA end-binding protein Ku
MRAIWKGTISFGLVTIPIALGVATRRSDPSFRMLDARTHEPVKQQLVTGSDGQTLSRDQTVKGYEVSKGQFVVLSDAELESVAAEREHTINIVAFIDAAELDPVYYDRSYYVQPQEHGVKPYALLAAAMKETGKAAVGKLVLSGKQYLALLRPSGDTLVLELLFYPEDVRSASEIEDAVGNVGVSDQELSMARQLIESLARPFDPAEFTNEHKQAVMRLIEQKLAGEEVSIQQEPEPAPAPDLMAALKASLEQTEKAGSAKASGDRKQNGRAKTTSRQKQTSKKS